MWQLCLDCGHRYDVHTDLGLNHDNWGLGRCEVAHCDCERFSQEMENFSVPLPRTKTTSSDPKLQGATTEPDA